MNRYTHSEELFERAGRTTPGGVNSPVRAFRSVGGTPVFMKSAKGAYLFDVDGNKYIDYISSWGPMILGHCHPAVVKAIQEKAEEAISFGAPTELEIQMAELITTMAPNVDLVRMVSSGTEACMSAIRLARGFTGKAKIIKFDGCYHGHADSFLVKAGSGLATLNIQTVPGITPGVTGDTLVAPYNNLGAVEHLIRANAGDIAALIIEPVAGNMGCILPEPGFLEGIRTLCTTHQIVLIFDEVMTGFRLAPGGAQEKLGIRADLVTYGKVIGGGMPVGAFGGRNEIMQQIAPLGSVYQAGTLSGNPVATVAGFTTLSILKNNPEIYSGLEAKAVRLKTRLNEILIEKGIAHTINQLGSMISVHFANHRVKNFETAAGCDITLFNRFFHHMLSGGVYLPPSAFESWFLNDALSEQDIEQTLKRVKTF
ncbi:MAG TPA: glutamate-1-semialdehyde 2,1-aminomutase [Bacteroidia bacterium]|jgi:glutamate-1-semialdehyde 2,1-aminomutase|nr:glutamate-1-semialdehyde 2,1-aminomutase [Bacteroidia bacterium]